MENKLEQLTQKLRAEGLERGKAEAEAMVAEAKAKAKQIVAEANAMAEKTLADAKAAAAELAKNTANDVRMASEQTMSMLRKEISEMVLSVSVAPKVSAKWESGEFVKTIITEAVKSWKANSDEDVAVVVPEAMLSDLKGFVAKTFQEGVEVKANANLKVPFRIEPKAGGYYVSFSDGDFTELLKQALRPKVSEFLFAK